MDVEMMRTMLRRMAYADAEISSLAITELDLRKLPWYRRPFMRYALHRSRRKAVLERMAEFQAKKDSPPPAKEPDAGGSLYGN